MDKLTEAGQSKIEFPCNYPVKVIVEVNANIISDVTAIIEKHDARMSPEKMEQNPSRNSKFISLRFMLWATGTAQLEKLFEDLKQCDAVKMVL
ncbi:MAG: DUF493 domain-containing protein [Pseudomonadales bacterium]|nr:DUF493 domain-containing protein [Pseudomonadales bacterium]